MSAFRAASFIALLALGCSRGGMPRLAEPKPAPAGSSEKLRWVGIDVARATYAGAGPPLLVASGAGGPGDTLGGRVEVPVADCVLVLARGSPSIEDLDVFVYADDGAVLGADDKPSTGAGVLVCPPHPRHIYAFGRLAAGHGMVSVSAQLVRRADAERTAQAVGAKGELALRSLPEQGWPGLDDALRTHRRALGATFRDIRRLAAPLDARIGTRLSVATETDECLDIFVLPSEDVALVDVTVLDSEGRIVARASGEDRAPTLVVCAPQRSELTVELRPHAGRGLAAVIIGANGDPRTRKNMSAEFTVHDLVPTLGLTEARRATSGRLGQLGYPPARTVTEGTAQVGARVALPVDIPEGCSRLDVVAGAPTRNLDAWLWSQSGALVAHDDGSSSAVLFACGAAQGARLDVEAVSRGGPYAVEIRSLAGPFTKLSRRPLAASRLLGRLDANDGIRTPRDATGVTELKLSAEKLSTERRHVARGVCLDAALALDVGAEGAELRVVDADTGAEIALARGTHSAIATACALEKPGDLRVSIEMRVGAGAADALLATLERRTAAAH
jgi:hypothetical protein